MSGPTTPASPPPEVPEEFAAAYRAAYEEALAAQTSRPERREDPEPEDPRGTDTDTDLDEDSDEDVEEAREGEDADGLPVRRGPLRVGTHRWADRDGDEDDDTPTWFDGVRDSTWFVPFLLVLLAILLILGAYVVGRRFAGEVAGEATPSAERSVVIGKGGNKATGDQRQAGFWGLGGQGRPDR